VTKNDIIRFADGRFIAFSNNEDGTDIVKIPYNGKYLIMELEGQLLQTNFQIQFYANDIRNQNHKNRCLWQNVSIAGNPQDCFLGHIRSAKRNMQVEYKD
jgi:hypothetical protein